MESAKRPNHKIARQLREKASHARCLGLEPSSLSIRSILSLPEPKLGRPTPVYLPRNDLQETPMTSYTVQYVLPVDNPVNNVRMSKQGKNITFEVPINYPDAHKLGFSELMDAAELSGLFAISPPLNNRKISRKELTVIEEQNKKTAS